MKNSFYFLAEFLIVLWIIALLGFDTNKGIHFLILLSGIIILIRISFDKKLTSEENEKVKRIELNKFKP